MFSTGKVRRGFVRANARLSYSGSVQRRQVPTRTLSHQSRVERFDLFWVPTGMACAAECAVCDDEPSHYEGDACTEGDMRELKRKSALGPEWKILREACRSPSPQEPPHRLRRVRSVHEGAVGAGDVRTRVMSVVHLADVQLCRWQGLRCEEAEVHKVTTVR